MDPVGVPNGPERTSRRPPLLDAGVLTGCRHRVGLDHDPAAVRPEGLEDSGVAQRRAGAAEARARARWRLRAAAARTGRRWVDVPGTSVADRVAATVAALRSDADRIWGATLPADLDAGRRGFAELLVRSGTGLAGGKVAGGWIPVLVTNHRVSDPGSGALTTDLHHWAPALDDARAARSHPRDQLRLAHLHRLLQHSGAAVTGEPARGGVIGLDADCIVVHELDAPTWASSTGELHSTLTELDLRFADRRAVADGVIGTRARRVAECRTCPWWPRCSAELTAHHDVSLVVRGVQAQVLEDLGVRTVDTLAAWEGPDPAAWRGGVFADAVVLARAWLAGVSLVRRGQVRLRRADVEVDVDMESHLEDGAYLWGTLLTERGTSAGYRPFVTWEPLPCADEARSFAEFWAWLRAVRADAAARGLTFAAYCYSEAAENRWMLGSARRFAGVTGVPAVAEVQAFLDSDDWVDVYATVSRDFLCPNGKGLKKIAPVAGFTWRDADAGGEASMGWYRRAVGLGGPVEPDQRQRLLDYNADDVTATKVLREWMTSASVLDVPLASEL